MPERECSGRGDGQHLQASAITGNGLNSYPYIQFSFFGDCAFSYPSNRLSAFVASLHSNAVSKQDNAQVLKLAQGSQYLHISFFSSTIFAIISVGFSTDE